MSCYAASYSFLHFSVMQWMNQWMIVLPLCVSLSTLLIKTLLDKFQHTVKYCVRINGDAVCPDSDYAMTRTFIMDSGFAPNSQFALDLSLKPKWRDTFNIPRDVDYINLGSDYCIYSWDFLRREHSPMLLRKRPLWSNYDVPGLISYCACIQTSGAARFATMVQTWKILIPKSTSVAATSTYRNSSPGCQIETTKTTAKFIFHVFPREQMTTSTG